MLFKALHPFSNTTTVVAMDATNCVFGADYIIYMNANPSPAGMVFNHVLVTVSLVSVVDIVLHPPPAGMVSITSWSPLSLASVVDIVLERGGGIFL